MTRRLHPSTNGKNQGGRTAFQAAMQTARLHIRIAAAQLDRAYDTDYCAQLPPHIKELIYSARTTLSVHVDAPLDPLFTYPHASPEEQE